TAEIEMPAQALGLRVLKASRKRPARLAVTVFCAPPPARPLSDIRACHLNPAPRTTTGARVTTLTEGREARGRPLPAALVPPIAEMAVARRTVSPARLTGPVGAVAPNTGGVLNSNSISTC